MPNSHLAENEELPSVY